MNVLFKAILGPLRPQKICPRFVSHLHMYSVPPKRGLPEEVKEKVIERKQECRNILKGTTKFNEEQWNNIREMLLQREIKVPEIFLNEANVDGVILRLCLQYGLHEAGRSFFNNYLKKKKTLVSDVLMSRYMQLCSIDREYALAHKEEIISIYKYLKRHDVIEPHIGERCIAGITLFEDCWKEAFDLIESIKNDAAPTNWSFCSLIEACFNFNEIEKGWDILETQMERESFNPSPSCFIAYINHCEKRKKEGKFRVEMLERMFIFLEDHALKIPTMTVVEKLSQFISSLSDDNHKWSLTESFIPKSGVCSVCRRVLNPVTVTSSEFEELSKHFIKKAIYGSNVFLKTNPKEVEGFKSFLKKSYPYDIVIDGLNVAYGRGEKRAQERANTLNLVVTHFLNKKMKIVVFGRQHMRSWPGMDYVFENAKVFLAQNLSQDDPFLLLATMRGGESTCLISRDMMRGHSCLLEDTRLKRLFKKWLISHQYNLSYFSRGQPVIEPPQLYQEAPQKLLTAGENELCWHIPFIDEYNTVPMETVEPPCRWLCLRRISEKK